MSREEEKPEECKGDSKEREITDTNLQCLETRQKLDTESQIGAMIVDSAGHPSSSKEVQSSNNTDNQENTNQSAPNALLVFSVKFE